MVNFGNATDSADEWGAFELSDIWDLNQNMN